MITIPPAMTFLLNKKLPNGVPPTPQQVEEWLIEFAKLHVEKALKAAAENARLEKAYDYGDYDEANAEWKPTDERIKISTERGHGDYGYTAVRISESSILSSYDLEDIE